MNTFKFVKYTSSALKVISSLSTKLSVKFKSAIKFGY